MGANPGSRDSYPGGGAGTGVAGWSPSDRSDVDGINLTEEAPSSWTVCSSLKATRLRVPDREPAEFLAGVGCGVDWVCFLLCGTS